MSLIAKLKLSTQAIAQTGKLSPKEALRVRAINHLTEQHALISGQLSDTPYLPSKSVYRADASGNRVRVQEPRHIRRNWFTDAKGTVFFAIRYGTKALPLDKAGNVSIEVGKLADLPGVIDTLIEAIKTGELDTQLAAAATERRKNFKRRTPKLPQA